MASQGSMVLPQSVIVRIVDVLSDPSGFVKLVSEGLRSPRSADVSEHALYVAMGTIGLYFAALFLAWFHVSLDIFRSFRARAWLPALFLMLMAAVDFVVTWYFIITFLVQDYWANHSNHAWDQYLVQSDWLVKAYEMVTATPAQWWISSQLLLFAVSLTIFVYVEGHRCGVIRPGSNMVLGCLGAISLSFPLFLVSFVSKERATKDAAENHTVHPSKVVLTGTVAALALVPLLAHSGRAHAVVLAAIHVCVILPICLVQLFPKVFYPSSRANVEVASLTNNDNNSNTRASSTGPGGGKSSLALRPLRHYWLVASYSVIAGFNMATVGHIFLDVFQEVHVHKQHTDRATSVGSVLLLVEALADTLSDAVCKNPCQCSISFDLLFVYVVVAFYLLFLADGRLNKRLVLVCLLPVLGVASVFPVYLAYRETTIVPVIKTTKSQLAKLQENARRNSASAMATK